MTFWLLFFFLPLISSQISTVPICGNGVRETGEECDDGNGDILDGCSKNCTIEVNFLCINDSKTMKNVCYQDNPLTAELSYVAHSNPAEVELFFNRPLSSADLFLYSRSIMVQFGTEQNGSSFTWNLEKNPDSSPENKSFLIVLQFKSSFLRKKLTVTFLVPSIFKDVFGKILSPSSPLLEVFIPSHAIFSEEAIEFIQFMKGCVFSVMIVMLILSLPLSFFSSLGIFWNLFDSCQLFQILALINFEYPEPIREYFKGFAVTNFRLVDYFHEDLDKGQYSENPDLSYYITDNSYSTMFLANAFYTLLYMGLFLMVFLILAGLSRLSPSPGSWPMRLRNLFGYSCAIRATMITYMPFAIATMLQLLNFRFDGTFNAVNSLFALAWLFYLVLLPFVYLALLNNKELLNEEEEAEAYSNKVKPLIELLNIRAILKRNFQLFYTIRKFLWATLIILLGDDVLQQIFWVNLVQVCMITLFMLKKPYKETSVNYMLIFTETLLLFTLFLISMLVSFDYLHTDINPDVRIDLSWAIVGCLSAIVFIKLCFVIIEMVRNLQDLIPKAKRLFRKFDEDDNFIEMGEYTSKGTEGKSMMIMESNSSRGSKT